MSHRHWHHPRRAHGRKIVGCFKSVNFSNQHNGVIFSFHFIRLILVCLPVFDAWAKIPPGITQGRLTWPGDMLLCERVNSEESMYGQELTVKGIRGSWSMLTVNLDNTSLAQYLQELVIPVSGKDLYCSFSVDEVNHSCKYSRTHKAIPRSHLGHT